MARLAGRQPPATDETAPLKFFSDSGTRNPDWKISIKSVDINLSVGFAHRPRLLMLVSLLRETNR
ncbi:hypothetical protein ACFSTD_11625 [Novosphingobium colocasiae]